MGARVGYIAGLGVTTPIGLSAAETAASVQAGVSRYAEGPVCNRRFDPMTMALLPEDALDELVGDLADVEGLSAREERMLRLAGPAMAQALAPLPPGSRVPLFLAVPEPLPGQPPVVDAAFLERLAVQSGSSLDGARSRIVGSGRAAGVEAIGAALQHLEASGGGHVLVGGVDTYLDLVLLATLDAEDRILADRVMDGFAPGEGAAFLLISAQPTSLEAASGTMIRIHSPGAADEEGHRRSDRPYRGDGLARAVTLALEAIKPAPVASVLAGLNGESYGAKEWGVAALRNSRELGGASVDHPIDCFGDTGAALGPVLTALAAQGVATGFLAAPVLVWCSSEGSRRAAVCIDAVGR